MLHKMRRFDQQISNTECIRLLNEGKRGVLSVNGDDGYPYGVPINYFYDEVAGKIYFHSAKEGHKIDAIKNNDKVCFITWCDNHQDEDGWSWYVDSVIVVGRAELIGDKDKIIDIVAKLGLKYYQSIDEVEQLVKKYADMVQLVAINIEHITGKSVHEK